MRNVSDSGISVDSLGSDPDDSAGKIVAESMQKIEAQMKRILEHENKTKNNKEKESLSTAQMSSPIKTPCQQDQEFQIKDSQAPGVKYAHSTGSEDDGSRRGSLKNGSFEVMEDFEEAPAEFDLGISSYSIAHPIEKEEELEKTPVPEILETDEPPKYPYEETPYTVSTPSGTLKHDHKQSVKLNGDSQSSRSTPAAQTEHTSQPSQQRMNNGYFGEMPSLNQSFFNPAFNINTGEFLST